MNCRLSLIYLYSNYEACCYCYSASERNNLLNHKSILRDNLNWQGFLSHVAHHIIYHSRFFLRVGHETTNPCSGSHHFFTILRHPQTYQKMMTWYSKKNDDLHKMHSRYMVSGPTHTQNLWWYVCTYSGNIILSFDKCSTIAHTHHISHRHWQEAFKIAWITGWLLPIMHH